MYAVNIADLTAHLDDFPLMLLIRPVIHIDGERVQAEKGRIDSLALTLDCPSEQASAIIEIVRMHYKKHQLRLYHSKTGNGGWRRV